MIRYLTYTEDGEDVTVDTALRRSNEANPLDGMSNYVKPEGSKFHRKQFISVEPFPEKVWIVVTRHPYCNCGCGIIDGVCQRIEEHPFQPCKRQGRKTNEFGASCDIEGNKYNYRVHGPFTEKTELENDPYSDNETWHFLPVEAPTTPDVDIQEISNWTVDEFGEKVKKVREAAFYTKDYSLIIPVWFSKTSLSNRKEWCRRQFLKQFYRTHRVQVLDEEELQIVGEMGGEKMSPELLESVKKNHPKKEFVVHSGSYCSDLVAYYNRIDVNLVEGYVFSVEPH